MLNVTQYFVFLEVLCIAGLIINGIISLFSKSKKTTFIASSILLAIMVFSSAYLNIISLNTVFFNIMHIYAFSSLFVALFAITMLIINTLAYFKSKNYQDINLLLGLSFAAMFIVSTSISILSIFIGLELLTVSTTFMILLEGKNKIEAAIKLFILGTVSVAIFTLAIAMLLPYNSTMQLVPAIQNQTLGGITLLILSMLLFAVALGFDTALFPFNLWIPDVYEGASTFITSMLAGVNKKVAFVAMIEIFILVFLAYKSTFSSLFVILAIVTMFFGNLIALTQKNVKRMLAYSSISQAGYILIGLAAASQYGIEASIFYMIAHSFMIIGAFTIVMWLESNEIHNIDDYNGLSSRNGFAAASFAIIMLSMAGIPPLIGFTGKFLLFSSAVTQNLAILAVIGTINSFISIYYYSRIINAMYLKNKGTYIPMEKYIMIVIALVLLVVVIFGVYPQPLISIASKASASLFGF
jgi:proton-translocating NADH-quinone oxidoreductase chain N